MSYLVIAPNGRIFAQDTDWNDAVDVAVSLSLKWGVLFRVGLANDKPAPFHRERLRVAEEARTYVKLVLTHPKSISTEKAKSRFESAKRDLNRALVALHELNGSDLVERRALNHPIKGFRSDVV